jgi:hypothetical protein
LAVVQCTVLGRVARCTHSDGSAADVADALLEAVAHREIFYHCVKQWHTV